MEIPYELKHLRYQLSIGYLGQNYYIKLEPKLLFYYLREFQMYILAEIIDNLGKLSNEERQLLIPETNYFSFICSYNKKIILKCMGDMIIGFIYFKEDPLFLPRNYFDFGFFNKNMIKILDFFIQIIEK